MKVLHVIPAVAARYGGPSRAIFEMCHALQKEGIEPLIATSNADGEGRLPVELGRAFVYNGVPTIFFSRQWSEAFKYSHPLARWLDTNVDKYDAVHIHAVFSHSSLAAAKACREHSVPYVVRPLGSLDPWSLQQKRLRKRLFWQAGVRQMLQGAAAIHYTTPDEQRLAESALGLERGVVIPLGVETELLDGPAATVRFSQLYPALEDHPYILVLSRLHPKKGLELLLESFLSLVKQQGFEHWRLVVAGEGEAGYVASLRRLVQENGGERYVLFPGWLEKSQKTSALQNAALLALPSHQENFGLCVIEALACGVPVLISPHVNLASNVAAAEVGWIAPLEKTAIVKTLAEALRNDDERARRGSAGREFVYSRFLWSAVAAKLTALYHSIIKKELPLEAVAR